MKFKFLDKVEIKDDEFYKDIPFEVIEYDEELGMYKLSLREFDTLMWRKEDEIEPISDAF